MRGIAGQEQPAVAHGRADETAHRRDALVQDLAILEIPAGEHQPLLQFGPDPLVRPARHFCVRVDLEVKPADRRAAQAVQRKSAPMAGVDQLIGGCGTSAKMPSQANG
jgi:hypothetical protein